MNNNNKNIENKNLKNANKEANKDLQNANKKAEKNIKSANREKRRNENALQRETYLRDKATEAENRKRDAAIKFKQKRAEANYKKEIIEKLQTERELNNTIKKYNSSLKFNSKGFHTGLNSYYGITNKSPKSFIRYSKNKKDFSRTSNIKFGLSGK